MIDHQIFEDLQSKIDEETAVRDVRKRKLRAKPTAPRRKSNGD